MIPNPKRLAPETPAWERSILTHIENAHREVQMAQRMAYSATRDKPRCRLGTRLMLNQIQVLLIRLLSRGIR